jgi:hypothetical protein
MKPFLIVFRLIVFCFVFLPMLCSAQAANSAPDEWPFEEAMQRDTIQDLEAFLSAYPESEHRERVLEELIILYRQAGDESRASYAAKRLWEANPSNTKAREWLSKQPIFPRPAPEQTSTSHPDSKPAPEQAAPSKPHESKPTSMEQEKPTIPQKVVSSGSNIVVAIISAIAAILAAYWQFVYKPRQDSGASLKGGSGNSVVQAPVINVSPSFNISHGNADLDARLKEQTIRQNELAEQTSLCRQLALTSVNQAKKKHGQNSLSFSENQLNAWASPYSHRLHAVLDALRTEGRARAASPGYWLID